MKSPEEIERSLKRLVPPPLSEKAHADVSAMLASLAAESAASATHATAASSLARPWLSRLPASIAAALVIGLVTTAVWITMAKDPQPALMTQSPAKAPLVAETDTAPVLIDRMSVTDGITVEGTLTAADGSVVHEVKRRVQTRERYRDAKKGYLITISETRDEKLYTPKKGF